MRPRPSLAAANGPALKAGLRALKEQSPVWPAQEALLPFARSCLGVTPGGESEWYRAAWWGFHAARLLFRFREQNRISEILDLVEPTDWSPIEGALASKKGVILAGAHLGPGNVPTLALTRAGFAFQELSGRPGAAKHPGRIPVLSDTDRKASLVRALLHLRRGGIINTAPDGRYGSKHFPVRFLGQNINIRVGIGELARLSGASTFWLSASWSEINRIHCRIEPIVIPDVAGDKWLKQWHVAYLKLLGSQMRRSPADLGFMNYGIWAGSRGGLHWYRPSKARTP